MELSGDNQHRHFERARSILDELERMAEARPVRLRLEGTRSCGAARSSSLQRLIYIGTDTLDTLDHTEIVVRAVLAHEMGHIELKHFYWNDVAGTALFFAIVPAGLAIGLASGSWLAGLLIPPAVYFLYGAMVRTRRAMVLYDTDPHEQAADRYAADLVGGDVYGAYQQAMRSAADFNALLDSGRTSA